MKFDATTVFKIEIGASVFFMLMAVVLTAFGKYVSAGIIAVSATQLMLCGMWLEVLRRVQALESKFREREAALLSIRVVSRVESSESEAEEAKVKVEH